MSLDLSEGWAKTIVCYRLWTCKNEKRHSSIMMGELREGNHFANQMVVVCLLWTWHLYAYHSINWVFNWLISQSNFMSHVTPLSLSKECIVHSRIACPSVLVTLPSIFSFRPMFKGDHKKCRLCSPHSICVSIFESFIWLLHTYNSRTIFLVLCRRCGTHHGPPSMRLFPPTSAHHLGNSLRNNI